MEGDVGWKASADAFKLRVTFVISVALYASHEV